MKTKFTPAPWSVTFDNESDSIEIAMSSYLENLGSYYSCHRVLIEADDEEAISNAHLIAAAPEMYEALSSFLILVENDSSEDFLYKFDEIKTLLAKARGEK